MSSGLTDDMLNSTEGLETNGDTSTQVEAKAPKEAAPEPEASDTEEGEPAETSDTGEGEEKPENRNKASDRIKQLAQERRDARRELEAERERAAALEARLARLEQGFQNVQPPQEDQAPDASQYEYGALDDRYIQDSINYVARQQVQAQMGQMAQQQQEYMQNLAQQSELQQIQAKAHEIVNKGTTLHDDFEEVVWEGGLRGDYKLEKATFDAITEADNPERILYALASDPAEARRVAALTPAQQAKYVFQKDSEFAQKPARASKAPPPPGTTTRGSTGRFTVSGDTEDLDAFEKEFFKKKA